MVFNQGKPHWTRAGADLLLHSRCGRPGMLYRVLVFAPSEPELWKHDHGDSNQAGSYGKLFTALHLRDPLGDFLHGWADRDVIGIHKTGQPSPFGYGSRSVQLY